MFREDKTTQMAARFLSLANGRLEYIKLLKLLYLADKKMLIQRGHPITYDDCYAMKWGPVLSKTYDIIKGERESDYWSVFIETNGYDVELKDDPGSGKLSRAEDRIIDEVFEEYQHQESFDLVRHLHDTLQEWQRQQPGNSSKKMTYKLVLQTEGFGQEDIDNILANIALQDKIESLLESH